MEEILYQLRLVVYPMEYFGDPYAVWIVRFFQVIQAVSFLSPNVGGLLRFLKGSRELTIPKMSPAELPGIGKVGAVTKKLRRVAQPKVLWF